MNRVVLILLSVIAIAHSARINSSFKLLHQDKTFVNRYFLEGRELLILPLIYDGKFYRNIPFSVLEGPLKDRGDLVIISDYAKITRDDSIKYSDIINRWEPAILGNDILEALRLLPLFLVKDYDYIQVIRIVDFTTVKAEHEIAYKRCRLECEIYDIRSQNVIWRGEVFSDSKSKRVKDRDIIKRSIVQLYEKLPHFYFGHVRSNW